MKNQVHTSPLEFKEKALYFRIEINSEQARMIDTGSLVKVLNAINASFQGFMEAEIYSQYVDRASVVKKETKQLILETKLWIADFDFAAFTLTIIPDLSPSTYPYRVLNNPSKLKEELFLLFKDAVFSTDIFSSANVEQIGKKYKAKERIGIFKSIYDDIINQDNFIFYYGSNKAAVNKRWFKTEDKELLSCLIPERVKKAKKDVETYYQYVKTGEENDLFGKRSKYKKVLVKETVKHDVYPYQLQKLRIDQKEVLFSRQLSAAVTVEDNLYCIALAELNISVKNEHRADAEAAFDADLAALIVRFEKGGRSSVNQKEKMVFLKLQEIIADV